ncbi:hypothetical protein ElyMa_005179800 [Elysia marginata]|uniref:Uncharacterized protein n=1 Tax=Elysia marginata TaxID=1093978 RepID=A0AAV4JU83_9GAST|nr:hypothetical protein ElyMa_005179800 [Elysia marginata]
MSLRSTKRRCQTSSYVKNSIVIHRGFYDANLFVAQTTQPKVAPMSTSKCHKENRRQVCNHWTARFYYHTPVAFYSSGKVEKDPADTAKAGAGVLDKNGQIRMMSSSGIRIRTPEIEGVGVVRTRYPIMPVHGEGSPVWKELNALKEMSMHMNRYASLYEERPGQMTSNDSNSDLDGIVHYQLSLTYMDPPGEHSHDFFLNKEEVDELKRGVHIMVTTSLDLGHEHELELVYRHNRVKILRCDKLSACWDGHGNFAKEVQF